MKVSETLRAVRRSGMCHPETYTLFGVQTRDVVRLRRQAPEPIRGRLRPIRASDPLGIDPEIEDFRHPSIMAHRNMSAEPCVCCEPFIEVR